MIQEIVVFISSVNGLIDLKKADLVGRILAILKFILQKVIPLSKGKSWGAATTKIENYLNIHKLQRSNAIRN